MINHLSLPTGIEVGNGLPDLEKPSVLKAALRKAGFEIIEDQDFAQKGDSETPWFLSLSGSFSLTGTFTFPAGGTSARPLLGILKASSTPVSAVPSLTPPSPRSSTSRSLPRVPPRYLRCFARPPMTLSRVRAVLLSAAPLLHLPYALPRPIRWQEEPVHAVPLLPRQEARRLGRVNGDDPKFCLISAPPVSTFSLHSTSHAPSHPSNRTNIYLLFILHRG